MEKSIVACGFNSIKIDYYDYQKSGLIQRNFAEWAEAVPIALI